MKNSELAVLYSHLTGEDAPGIPRLGKSHKIRSVKNLELWEFCIQLHSAHRAGKHRDLRLGDPKTGYGHSWALRHFPKINEKRLAVRTSTHTLSYFDFEGRIPAGEYGAGTVKLDTRGKAIILSSSNDKIDFLVLKKNLRKGTKTGSYTLVRMKGNHWLLMRWGVSKFADII
jgi:bifunctional non-homologous end joining protein LigD